MCRYLQVNCYCCKKRLKKYKIERCPLYYNWNKCKRKIIKFQTEFRCDECYGHNWEKSFNCDKFDSSKKDRENCIIL
jgi:hypothetical protein